MSPALVIFADVSLGQGIGIGIFGVVIFCIGLHAVATKSYPLAFWDVRLVWRLFGHEHPPVEGGWVVHYGITSMIDGGVMIVICISTILEADFGGVGRSCPTLRSRF
jgi:hypothetical protein